MTDVDRGPRIRRGGRPGGGRPDARSPRTTGPVGGARTWRAGRDRPGADPSSPRPLGLAAVAAAAYAVGIGLAVVVALVLLVWALSPHGDASLDSALRVAGLVWLGVNRIPVTVGSGALGVLPWLFLAFPLLLLYRAGGWAARSSRVAGLADAALLVAAIAAAYGLAAGVVAVWSTVSTAAVVPVHAVAGGAVVAVAGATPGVVVAAGLWPRLRAAIPAASVPALRGGVAAFLVLLGGAAVVAATAVALRLPDVADVARALSPGVVGGVALAVIGAGYAPVAVSWALAYVVGTGVEVGSGTVVSPFTARLGELPALPWLAALPDPVPRWAPLLLGVPVVAGAIGGAVLLRSLPSRSAPVVVGDVLAVAAVAGAAAGVLAALSTGGLGPGRLAVAGPSPVLVGAATTGLVLAGAAITVTCETAWRRATRGPGTA